MKIEFKKIRIKNFLSFGNKEAVYEFERGKIINIKGRNLDTDAGKENGSSNGSGKSSVIQSMTYAIYGTGISDIKQDEFINITNGKDMKVVLELTADGKDVVITRTRKPNAVSLVVDDEDLTRDSIANTNKLIQEIIGVEYETFILSFVMTTSVKPLLSRKPAEQRNFMEDLLGMNTLTERADRVKKIKSEAEVEFKLAERDIENALQWNEHEVDRVESAKKKSSDFERQRKEKLSELKEKIDSMADILDHEEEIRESLKKLAEAEHSVDQEESELRDLEKEAQKLSTKKAELEKEINVLSSTGDILRSKIEDQQATLDKAETDVKSLSEREEGIYHDIRVIEEAEKIEDSISGVIECIEKTNGEIKQEIEEKATSEDELSHLKDGQCPHCRQQWTPEDQQDKIKELENKASKSQASIEFLEGCLDAYEKDRDELKKTLRGMNQFPIDNADSIIREYDKVCRDLKEAQKTVETSTDAIQRLQTELKSDDSSEQLKSVEGDLKACKRDLSKVTSDIEKAEKSAEKALRELEKVSKGNEKHTFANEPELDAFLARAEGVLDKYEELEQSENPYKTGEEPDLKDVQALEAKRSSWDIEIKHCKYLIKLLTDSKSFIRRNIIGRYVPYLNKQINVYADKLDSPHVCEIQNDLTVKIEYMRKSVSYHNLSAGERLKLDISTSIALRDLMAMLGTKSGLLVVDEVFDSALDTQSKRNVFKLMRERFETVLLVSHSGEFDDKCDDTLTVVKENGFSRFA